MRRRRSWRAVNIAGYHWPMSRGKRQGAGRSSLAASATKIKLRDMKAGDPIPDDTSHVSNHITTEQGCAAYIGNEMVGAVTFTVRSDGDAHGGMMANGRYADLDEKDPPNTFIHWLFVYPNFRQQGIANRLLDHVHRRFGLPLSGWVTNDWIQASWDRWSKQKSE